MRRISMLMLGAALFGFGTTRMARGDEMPGRATAMAEEQIQTRFQSDADLRNNQIQAIDRQRRRHPEGHRRHRRREEPRRRGWRWSRA